MTGWMAGVGRHRRIGERHKRLIAEGVVTGLTLLVSAASAQASSPQAAAPPAGSLVVDPQQGATPRPLPTPTPAVPSLPPQSLPAVPIPSPIGPIVVVPTAPSVTQLHSSLVVPSTPAPEPFGLTQQGGLPGPSGDPLRIDPVDDPILAIARSAAPAVTFNHAIAEAVARNPALGEVEAQADEADAVRREARERALFPTADLSLTSFQIISRAFSNDPGNVLERSRPRARTDGLVRVQQPVIDFGASLNRIRASEARLEAARADIEDTSSQVALQAVSAWYSVYGYRVLVRLAGAYSTTQQELRRAVETRVHQGAAAPADVAQVDSYIASADAQRADFRRQLISAEAQYAAVIGAPPPADLARAPVPSLDGIVRAGLAAETDKLPAARSARLAVTAAQRDAKALRADRLPQLGVSVDAGRYGVIETRRDYDVRGSVNLTMRIGGGAGPRVSQAEARVARADARLSRTRIELQRDAEIALSDVAALEDSQKALELNYLASRRSRDALVERFRVARGTVFELLGAQSNYFGVAARYIQSLIELDSARYALLARTGRLLPTLGIDPAALETPR
jgi:adhesin transport system outer membrane protein